MVLQFWVPVAKLDPVAEPELKSNPGDDPDPDPDANVEPGAGPEVDVTEEKHVIYEINVMIKSLTIN